MNGEAFRFRFQKILDIREKEERAVQIELSRVDRALLREQQSADRWERTRQLLLEELRRARVEANLELNDRCSTYLRHVRDRIGLSREETGKLRQERQGVLRKLEQALQSRKALENYRGRMKKEFLAAQEKAEEQVIDAYSAHKFAQPEGIP